MNLQVGLAVVNGQLMAVGGFDGTTYLKTIEVYDPDANTWRYVALEKVYRICLHITTMKLKKHGNYSR